MGVFALLRNLLPPIDGAGTGCTAFALALKSSSLDMDISLRPAGTAYFLS